MTPDIIDLLRLLSTQLPDAKASLCAMTTTQGERQVVMDAIVSADTLVRELKTAWKIEAVSMTPVEQATGLIEFS